MKKKNCPVCNRKDLDCLYCDDCGKVPIDFQTPAKQPTVNDELVKEIDEMIRNLIQGEYHYDSDLPPLLTKCKTALSQVKPSVWQPIETAPNDMTQVLCRKKDARDKINGGYFYDVWAGEALHRKAAEIVTGKYEKYGAQHLSYIPEEWQPLPAAPEADLIETIEK